MKKKFLIRKLEKVIEDIEFCRADSKESIKLFHKSWVTPTIEFCLRELRK